MNIRILGLVPVFAFAVAGLAHAQQAGTNSPGGMGYPRIQSGWPGSDSGAPRRWVGRRHGLSGLAGRRP